MHQFLGILGTVVSTLFYHGVLAAPVDVASAGCTRYCESENIFESNCSTIQPKFMNTLPWVHMLVFSLDSPWPWFYSNAFWVILACFSCFVSCPSNVPPLLSTGSAGHERWIIRVEQNSHGKSRKAQRQPLLVKWLGLSCGLGTVGGY